MGSLFCREGIVGGDFFASRGKTGLFILSIFGVEDSINFRRLEDLKLGDSVTLSELTLFSRGGELMSRGHHL